MKKVNFKLPLSLILLVMISCSGENSKSNVNRDEERRPNVLFILADDYGYSDLSCMGSSFYETPNIDKIANEGVIFTDGYAACRVCSPSRASIMTGQFTARHGITNWIGELSGEEWRKLNRYSRLLPSEYVHTLSAEALTLPEAMKQEGYKTFFAGKWHLGSEGSHPEDHGFDINRGGWDVGSPHGGYYAPYSNPKLECGPDGESLTMRLAEETSKFIKEHKDTTFFAFLSFYAVHGPIQTTQEKWQKYRDKAERNGIKESGYIMERRLPIRQEQDNPIYGGLVETMDDAVGSVLNTLKELGLDENTIVIFTSDNGGVSSGDNYSTSNLPLRGGKGYQWEGGIREPFFVKVPWIEGGVKSSTPVSGVDLYPTILDLVGADLRTENHVDGVSLKPLLSGGEIADRPLFWHYPHYGNQGGDPSSIIRYGNWKLIHYWEDGVEELYNLSEDLGEQNNLLTANRAKAEELSGMLITFLEETNAEIPVQDPEWDKVKEDARRESIRVKSLPKKERERLEYLSKDYNPNNNWWGSRTID